MVKYVALLLVLPGITGLGCDTQYGNLGYTRKPCPGQCMPIAPLGFDGPALLWFGAASEAAGCPERAPALVFEGINGIESEPLDCPPCACSQPACVLPEGLTASSVVCSGDPASATFTDYPMPAGWDGSCSSPATVPPALLGSIDIAPTTEQPCAPIVEVPQKPASEPRYGVRAFACAGEALEKRCEDPGHICLPSAEPPPPGFRQCIMYIGQDEMECPETYPDRHEFYMDMTDGRECTECTCTHTAASTCVARVSTYQDDSCSSASEVVTTMVGDMSSCADVALPNVQLGSMEAEWMVNQPGTCQAAGGEPIGEVTPVAPRIFCCQPPPGEGE